MDAVSRRLWLAAAGAGWVALTALHVQAHAQATPLVLLTEAEARRDQGQPEPAAPPAGPRSRSLRPQAPQIRVIAPQAAGEGAVPAPLRLELGFSAAAPGARIVPGSFRLLYGVLRIDLTERVRGAASISEQGVLLERAVMPPGAHRLWAQVSDDQGNLGEQELRFRVAASP
jgi:hypothetical protein